MAGHLAISMLPIHSRRPWASCNLYASYTFKTPMGILQSLCFLYIQDAHGHLAISMLPIHSRRPWASCNLYASYTFKTPMGILQSLCFLYIQDAHGHLVISMLPIHSIRPCESCNLYDVAACKDTTKIRICIVLYVLEGVSVLFTLGIL